MEIEDIRQERLRELLRQYKTQSKLAGVIGVAPDYISRLLSKGPNRKRLKEDLAREIERRANLPMHWFDRQEGVSVLQANAWPFSFFNSRFDRLEQADREKIDAAIVIMLSLCESGRAEKSSKKRAA